MKKRRSLSRCVEPLGPLELWALLPSSPGPSAPRMLLGTTGDHKTPGMCPPALQWRHPMFLRQHSWQMSRASQKTSWYDIIPKINTSPSPWVWGVLQELRIRSQEICVWDLPLSLTGLPWAIKSHPEPHTDHWMISQTWPTLQPPIRDALGEPFLSERVAVCFWVIVWFPA